MKEKELAFSDVPNNFLWCINRQCSKAETCLRQLAERLSPEELISCSAINPKHLAKFKNECPYFCSNKQVRYARGFLGILETSPPNKHTSSSTGSSVIPAAVPTIVSAMANGHYLLPSNKIS